MAITLSGLAITLGALVAGLNLFGVVKPAAFATVVRKFPRAEGIGWVFTLAGTAWFIYNLSQENISDFASFKPYLFMLFAAVGLGTCLFVRDFLSIRGLSVLLLLLAKLMVDTARWQETPWRLVIVSWAYVLVIAGMWFTISPWRMRDLIGWCNANDKRTRFLSGLRFAFGLFVLALGVTVF